MAADASFVPSVKTRLKALKKLNVEHTKLEAKFHNEVHMLEKKYLELYKPHYEKRYDIVSGAYEPTEEEAKLDSEEDEPDEDQEMIRMLRERLQVDKPDETMEGANSAAKTTEEVAKGVPEFWLKTLKNYTRLDQQIQPHDVPILKSLMDIRLSFLEGGAHLQGFKLDFVFEENKYFANTVLSKTYSLSPESDSPELLFNCAEGTKIDWKPGKNVTVETIRRKQRHRTSNQVRTTTRTEPRESFFNFFNPPKAPAEDDESEEAYELNEAVAQDYELGELLKDKIIPRAVRFFMGEDGDSEDEDDDEEDEEDDLDDDDLEEVDGSD